MWVFDLMMVAGVLRQLLLEVSFNLANGVWDGDFMPRSSWQFTHPRVAKCWRPCAASCLLILRGWNFAMGSLETDRRDDGIGARGRSGPFISNERAGESPVL